MGKFLRSFAFVVICYAAFLASAQGQTTTVIPANEAAAHIGEYASVKGVVAKVFTSKSGNTFLNIGVSYPKADLYGLDTAGFISLKIRAVGECALA
jgi:hypothetical protein